MAMNKIRLEKLRDPATMAGTRAAACIKRLKDGEDWEALVAGDAMMMYSDEFRAYVAGECGLDPNSGKPVKQDPPEEPEEEPTEEELDETEAEEGEEAAETEAEEEPEPEPEDEEAEGVSISPDNCHWCGVAKATTCLTVQISYGDEPRLLRVDHLCEVCASEYWNALHQAQKERMW